MVIVQDKSYIIIMAFRLHLQKFGGLIYEKIWILLMFTKELQQTMKIWLTVTLWSHGHKILHF